MKAILKTILFIILLVIFIYLTSILYIENLPVQFISLLIVLLISLFRFGGIKLLNEIKLLLPFILTMLSVYVLIGILGVRIANITTTTNSVLLFWLQYGLSRTILFSSTMFFIQFLLSYISINDILSFPMQIHKKRYLLLGRALFIHSIKYIEQLDFHLKLMPEYQKQKLSFRQWFRQKLQLSLAVIVMILRESRLKGELIDNRILHCFRKDIRKAI